MTAPTWHDDAACKDEDVDKFFVDHLRRSSNARVDQVRELVQRFCNRCPVVFECFTAALEFGDEFSVSGGTDGFHRQYTRMGKRTVVK